MPQNKLQRIAQSAEYFGLFRADRTNMGIRGNASGVTYSEKPYVIYAVSGERIVASSKIIRKRNYGNMVVDNFIRQLSVPRIFRVNSVSIEDKILLGEELSPGSGEYNKASKWIGQRSFHVYYNGQHAHEQDGSSKCLQLVDDDRDSKRNILRDKNAKGYFTREKVIALLTQ